MSKKDGWITSDQFTLDDNLKKAYIEFYKMFKNNFDNFNPKIVYQTSPEGHIKSYCFFMIDKEEYDESEINIFDLSQIYFSKYHPYVEPLVYYERGFMPKQYKNITKIIVESEDNNVQIKE